VTTEQDAPDDPVYLSFADALEIYAAIICATAAQAADYLRSRGALEAPLGRPASYARYGRRVQKRLAPLAGARWD
jgi:hypothetical protein